MSDTADKRVVGVIPARWASTRFPGKPLTPILGKPLLHWVIENAKKSRILSNVIVATDDERIRNCALEADATCFMTRADHPSGTDRVAEVAASVRPDAIINIQGDEPLIDPALIDRLGRVLIDEFPAWDMVTAATAIVDDSEIDDPNVVKAVFSASGQALYFSRARIPYAREAGAKVGYWQHIGVYGYTAQFLESFVAAPPCELEEVERLEQLRALNIGCRMKVVTTEYSSVGVDVPADISRVESLLSRGLNNAQGSNNESS